MVLLELMYYLNYLVKETRNKFQVFRISQILSIVYKNYCINADIKNVELIGKINIFFNEVWKTFKERQDLIFEGLGFADNMSPDSSVIGLLKLC